MSTWELNENGARVFLCMVGAHCSQTVVILALCVAALIYYALLIVTKPDLKENVQMKSRTLMAVETLVHKIWIGRLQGYQL